MYAEKALFYKFLLQKFPSCYNDAVTCVLLVSVVKLVH